MPLFRPAYIVTYAWADFPDMRRGEYWRWDSEPGRPDQVDICFN